MCCTRTVRRYQSPTFISPNSPGQRSDVDCCSEEDESDLDPGTKLIREKERRSANNQRERYVNASGAGGGQGQGCVLVWGREGET